MKLFPLAVLLLCPLLASAQLVVMVNQPKVVGQKAVVSLALKNNFGEKVESARAVVFLLDEHGKMVGQSTKWVIGGSRNNPGLAPGATNAFHFVIEGVKPLATTNLTAKVKFTRLTLDGRAADASKDVVIEQPSK